LRKGPRHCGQSSAKETEEASRRRAARDLMGEGTVPHPRQKCESVSLAD